MLIATKTYLWHYADCYKNIILTRLHFLSKSKDQGYGEALSGSEWGQFSEDLKAEM